MWYAALSVSDSLRVIHAWIFNRQAVMRRQADSYLNATQILNVAGIDQGRRTTILEK